MFLSSRFKNLNPLNQVVGNMGLRHTFPKANEAERQRKLYVKSSNFVISAEQRTQQTIKKRQQNYKKTADNEE